MFQVEALAGAAEFDVEVAADQLQGDFLAGVAGGEVDFAEPAVADAALDGVAGQRAVAAGVDEPPRLRRTASRPALGPFRASLVGRLVPRHHLREDMERCLLYTVGCVKRTMLMAIGAFHAQLLSRALTLTLSQRERAINRLIASKLNENPSPSTREPAATGPEPSQARPSISSRPAVRQNSRSPRRQRTTSRVQPRQTTWQRRVRAQHARVGHQQHRVGRRLRPVAAEELEPRGRAQAGGAGETAAAPIGPARSGCRRAGGPTPPTGRSSTRTSRRASMTYPSPSRRTRACRPEVAEDRHVGELVKTGTGTSRTAVFAGFPLRGSEPVPIFSQAPAVACGSGRPKVIASPRQTQYPPTASIHSISRSARRRMAETHRSRTSGSRLQSESW